MMQTIGPKVILSLRRDPLRPKLKNQYSPEAARFEYLGEPLAERKNSEAPFSPRIFAQQDKGTRGRGPSKRGRWVRLYGPRYQS